MNLKRDNWTNEEVIKILEGRKIVIDDKFRCADQLAVLQAHNDAIDQAMVPFYDFKLPDTEFGAMAYSTEYDRIYHIGVIPKDDECDGCHCQLTSENYIVNGDYLCNECYDSRYGGCCGGGCRKD